MVIDIMDEVKVDSHIEMLMEMGMIRESTSNVASPIVLVRKKDKT